MDLFFGIPANLTIINVNSSTCRPAPFLSMNSLDFHGTRTGTQTVPAPPGSSPGFVGSLEESSEYRGVSQTGYDSQREPAQMFSGYKSSPPK